MKTVHCKTASFTGDHADEFSFDLVPLKAHSPLGPRALPPEAHDLLDLATAIFRVERRVTGRQRTDPTSTFELTLPVRARRRWTGDVLCLFTEALHLLGNASWTIRVVPDSSADDAVVARGPSNGAQRVALFSGGLDSWCGASVAPRGSTRLVSFYTRQLELQQRLAATLEHDTPVQWSWTERESVGGGSNFYYRSLLFLTIAAITAYSHDVEGVLQYENGVLATGVPPSSAYRMTHHAHPEVVGRIARACALLLRRPFIVTNPFRAMTKRQAYSKALGALNKVQVQSALETQSCWSMHSPWLPGGIKKKPGRPCGVCIPCIVRRTAIAEGAYCRDLTRDAAKNHPVLGRHFRTYYAFLRQTLDLRGKTDSFYFLLDGTVRNSLIPSGAYSTAELHDLFATFGREFMDTFL